MLVGRIFITLRDEVMTLWGALFMLRFAGMAAYPLQSWSVSQKAHPLGGNCLQAGVLP